MHAYTPWKLPDTADLSSLLLRLRQGGWRPGAAPPEERGRLTCKYATLETVRRYVAPSILAVWGRCVQKQRQQAGFKGCRRVDQTQPSGHSPDFDSFPSFLPPRPPPCSTHPLPRSDVVGRTHVMHGPLFTVRLQSVHLGPGTVTLDWQIRAGLSAAGLKWCGRLRIRVLGRTSRADWIRLRRLRRLPDYVIVCPGHMVDLPGQARVALPSWACRVGSHTSFSPACVVDLVPPTRPGEVLVAADPAALVRLLRLG